MTRHPLSLVRPSSDARRQCGRRSSARLPLPLALLLPMPLAIGPWLLAACGAATAAGANTGAAPAAFASTAAGRGTEADFALNDVTGNLVHLSDFSGQVVLLDFWATWCDPCIAEMPHLQRLYEELRERGFVILAISMDGPETVAAVPTFVRQHGLTFPVLLDSETRVTNIYNPKRTAPLAILLDRNRRQARVRQGYVAGDELRLEEDVRGLVLHGRLP